MHAAVLARESEMVTWFLANGPQDVNFLSYENTTPLTVALERGCSGIADMLQSEGE